MWEKIKKKRSIGIRMIEEGDVEDIGDMGEKWEGDEDRKIL